MRNLGEFFSPAQFAAWIAIAIGGVIVPAAFASESILLTEDSGRSVLPIPTAACPQRVDGIHIGAVPILNYTSDRGMTLGAMARRFDYRSACETPFRNVVTLEASFATRGARIFEIAMEQTEMGARGLRGASVLSLTENEYQPYYGLGPQSRFLPALEDSGFYRFHQREILFENSVRGKIRGTFAEPQVGIAVARTSFSPAAATSQYVNDFGTQESSIITSRFFLRNVWEARDSEFIPSRGHYGLVGVTYAPKSLGNYGSDWAKWDGDYRFYLPLVEDRGLWLAHQFRYTGSTTDTPLSEKARLGSVGTLRGLPFSRYLGNHSASFRSDVRSVWLRANVFGLPFKLGSGVFYDLGKIADSLPGFGSERFHSSYGFSFFGSYFTDDFLGSLDFGFSEGSSIFYVRLGHAF